MRDDLSCVNTVILNVFDLRQRAVIRANMAGSMAGKSTGIRGNIREFSPQCTEYYYEYYSVDCTHISVIHATILGLLASDRAQGPGWLQRPGGCALGATFAAHLGLVKAFIMIHFQQPFRAVAVA